MAAVLALPGVARVQASPTSMLALAATAAARAFAALSPGAGVGAPGFGAGTAGATGAPGGMAGAAGGVAGAGAARSGENANNPAKHAAIPVTWVCLNSLDVLRMAFSLTAINPNQRKRPTGLFVVALSHSRGTPRQDGPPGWKV